MKVPVIDKPIVQLSKPADVVIQPSAAFRLVMKIGGVGTFMQALDSKLPSA
jgi:hypothetical protein